jgi:hypothetical protein
MFDLFRVSFEVICKEFFFTLLGLSLLIEWYVYFELIQGPESFRHIGKCIITLVLNEP